jgi:hypothetical protein
MLREVPFMLTQHHSVKQISTIVNCSPPLLQNLILYFSYLFCEDEVSQQSIIRISVVSSQLQLHESRLAPFHVLPEPLSQPFFQHLLLPTSVTHLNYKKVS